ncbi:MAG: TolC family protein [Ignavibacteriaceae bacterium]
MKFQFQKIFYLTAIFLILVDYSFAQETKKLTLEESVKIGLENSEEIHSANWRVTSADARWSEINTARFPSLSLNANYTRLSPIDPFTINTPFGDFELNQNIVNTYGVKLTLQQPIFTGFKLKSNSNIAEYNYLSVKEDFNRDKNDLIFNIKNAYWNLFKANEVKKVIDENIDQTQAHLNDVQNFFDQGLSTKNDLLKVQVQLAEIKLKQIDANNAVRIAMINLNNLMGISLSTKIEIADTVNPNSKAKPNLDELVENAYKNRPELKSTEFKVKASESAITLAQSGWYPQIFLTGNYNYARPNQRIFPSEDKFKGTWDVNVTASFTLWNWGATSDQTTQAEAQYEQAKDSYKMLKDNVTLEVTNNYLEILRAEERIDVANDNTKQAEENYRVTNQLFKNGITINSELIDAEVALLQAKTNYVQALVDYEVALARLEKSIGK